MGAPGDADDEDEERCGLPAPGEPAPSAAAPESDDDSDDDNDDDSDDDSEDDSDASIGDAPAPANRF